LNWVDGGEWDYLHGMELVDLLTKTYPSTSQLLKVCDDSTIPRTFLPSDAPKLLLQWNELLHSAHRLGKLRALIEVVATEWPALRDELERLASSTQSTAPQPWSTEQTPTPDHVRPGSDLLRLTRDGHLVERRVDTGRLRSSRRYVAESNIIVATDGSFIVKRVADCARVARVNRVTGSVAEWSRTVDLTDLGAGEALAVGAAGPSDLAFVWAASHGTDLFVARRTSGAPEPVTRLSDGRASGAVLHHGRVLVASQARSGSSTECPAFPDVDVGSMGAVSACGRTLVLAVGTDTEGRVGAWVEFDGRQRARLVDPDAYLELTFGRRRPPVVVTSAGRPAELSDVYSVIPYEHWICYASAETVASA
jgi:hypothetical protein